MCLDSKWRIPRMTFYSKKVYKVMMLTENGQVMSPFQFNRYDLKKEYTAEWSELYNEKCVWDCICRDEDFTYIYSGFFHSYVSKEYAEEGKKLVPNHNIFGTPYKIIIVECIIPPFTLYYKDKTNKEIASRRIKFNEIIIRYDY